MPKIGIVAQYLETRNDIRQIIGLLAKENDVYLYLRKSDLKNNIPNVEIREIEAKKNNIKNHVLNRLFYLSGRIPKSKNNYYITESFKIANTRTKNLYKVEKKVLLKVSQYVPKFISYDKYLDIIDYKPATKVDDIDVFLCFSEIYDDFLFSHLIHTGKKVFVYVYSWDHPCKMIRFSKRVHQYLVWNNGLKDDMITLQGIKGNNIQVLGSTQLAYVTEFKLVENTFSPPFVFDYLYFGCATGTPELVKQEVNIIKQVAEILYVYNPKLKLVVRPYPFLVAWGFYQDLKQHENIVLDNDFRPDATIQGLSKEKIYEKYIKIKYAKAFIHLGTTMGFEATYFNTPVLLINLNKRESGAIKIHDFIHQYQNDKYLILEEYPNIINDIDELEKKIDDLLKAPQKFLIYNQQVASQTELKSFSKLKDQLTSILLSFVK